ncbi:MAG: hypothetical protein LBL13_13155 [Bacteroidales bacterium]|jgi:hypothetical protein|nr:hypothetical protein [Bacteroidales bacterium]
MANENIISDKMFTNVIDGVATHEERRLVYDAIEEDDELRQAFNDCMYLKVFREEIETDFRKYYTGQTFGLKPSVEISKLSGIYQKIQLSVNNLEDDLKKSYED